MVNAGLQESEEDALKREKVLDRIRLVNYPCFYSLNDSFLSILSVIPLEDRHTCLQQLSALFLVLNWILVTLLVLGGFFLC